MTYQKEGRRPRMVNIVENALSGEISAIESLTGAIDTESIKRSGKEYFPFTDSNLELDFLTITHLRNVKSYAHGVNNIFYSQKLIEKASQIETSNSVIPLDRFQEALRLQEEARLASIQLVGIDISGTIITYISNNDTKRQGGKAVAKHISFLGTNIDPEVIVSAIETGFQHYSGDRKKDNVEIDEVSFYRRYVLPKLNLKRDPNEDEVLQLASLWRSTSVNLSLSSQKIDVLIDELKSREISVVTVSDMLGPMSSYALEKTNIKNLFDAHFCSSDFGVRKAKIEEGLYNRTLSVMKVKPENACFVGNDKVDDVMSSRLCGWGRQVYVNLSGSREPIETDMKITSLDELYDLLKDDKIPFLPKTERTPYHGVNKAERLDTDTQKILYALRQIAKGLPDRKLREWLYKNYLIYNCGDSTRIGNNVEIRYPERMYIGDNCQINDNMTILNEAPVIIGNNVMTACNTFIGTHVHDWRLGMLQDQNPSWNKGNTRLYPVSIESNVWIGPNCSIEAGAYIGHHSMVGANTYVPKGIYPPYSMITSDSKTRVDDISSQLFDKEKAYGIRK